MSKKIPTYSICNLLGANRCMTEFVVMRLRDFVESHRDLVFPHRHDFFQIVLFTQGGGQHSIDFEQFDVLPRQVYFMSPGQIHLWDFDEKTDGYLVNFHESFFSAAFHNPNFVREFPLFSNIGSPPVNILEMGCGKEVEQFFVQMLEEIESNHDFKVEMLRSLLAGMLVKLSRVQPDPFKKGISKHNLVLMRQFKQLIELHFHEKRLPKDYAELMFISPNHLNALTNSMVGASAGDLIRERVLLETKRLLVNSDLLIGQIANQLNFDDNAYFTRFFKKYTGTTPEVFRANFVRTVNR